MWKEFFYFNKSERRAVIATSVILALAITASFVLPEWWGKESATEQDRSEQLKAFEQLEAIGQANRFGTTRTARQAGTAEQSSDSSEQRSYGATAEISLHPFDPNTADCETLLGLGIPEWMAGNILKYRSKGGVFRKESDFRKIYGMTDERFNTLLPYIRIGQAYASTRKEGIKHSKSQQSLSETEHEAASPANGWSSAATTAGSSNSAATTERPLPKYSAGTIVDLNKADTTELKRIPGIGSATARKIVNYRHRLGGYYTPKQLAEIDASYTRFESWFTTDGCNLQPIEINKASVKNMVKHPYLNFYQARAIDEHRKSHGRFKAMRELEMYEEFSEHDIARLKPYLKF